MRRELFSAIPTSNHSGGEIFVVSDTTARPTEKSGCVTQSTSVSNPVAPVSSPVNSIRNGIFRPIPRQRSPAVRKSVKRTIEKMPKSLTLRLAYCIRWLD